MKRKRLRRNLKRSAQKLRSSNFSCEKRRSPAIAGLLFYNQFQEVVTIKFRFLWSAFLILISAVIFALPNYTILGEFKPETFTIHATLTVDVPEASIVKFNLYPNLHRFPNPYVSPLMRGSGYGFIRIESVTANGKALRFKLAENDADLLQKFSLKDTLLVVELPKGVNRLNVKFTLKIPEFPSPDEACWGGACVWRFGWYPILKGESQTGLLYSPHVCSASIKTPKDWDFISYEGAGVGCPLVLLKGYERFRVGGKNYDIVVHYRPGRRERAQVISSIALRGVEVLSRKFGRLDYKVVHIVQSPVSGVFGMTTNGVVVLGDGAFTTAELWVPGFFVPIYEFLVYHELSHLWFGIGTTVEFNRDNFLSESIAQYISVKMVEEIYGKYENLYDKSSPDILASSLKEQILLKSLRENFLYSYRSMWRQGVDTSVYGESEFLNQDYPKNYAKGLFAMRTLSLHFEDFDEVLKKYYETFKYKVVTYGDFKDFLESQKMGAGELLDKLFLSKGPIDAKVIRKENRLVVDLPNGVPYQIKISYRNGEEIKELTGPASFDLSEVKGLEIDPNWCLPDPERFNNSYPVKFILPEGFSKESTKIISPLEAYYLDPFKFELYLEDSNILVTYSVEVKKFDEWGVAIGGGYSGNIGDTVIQNEEYLIHGGGFYSPTPFLSLNGLGIYNFTNNGFEKFVFSVNGAIPEALDVGYTSKLFTPRNYFYFGFSYEKGYTPVFKFEHVFQDLIKFPMVTDSALYYLWDAGVVFGGFLDYIPLDFMNFQIQGMYSFVGDVIETDLNATQTYVSSYLSGGLGLHLNMDFEDRTNFFNFLSLRGVVLSASFSYEVGAFSGGLITNPTLTLGVLGKFYEPLDSLSVIGLYVRMFFSNEGDLIGTYFYLGYDITDYIISAYKTAISPVILVHPPESRIPLKEPLF